MNLTLTFESWIKTSYQILAFTDVYPHTNFGFSPTHGISVIDKNVRFIQTDGPTDQRTNKKFIGMRRSRRTHLKTYGSSHLQPFT